MIFLFLGRGTNFRIGITSRIQRNTHVKPHFRLKDGLKGTSTAVYNCSLHKPAFKFLKYLVSEKLIMKGYRCSCRINGFVLQGKVVDVVFRYLVHPTIICTTKYIGQLLKNKLALSS